MSYLNKEQLPTREQKTVDEIALNEVESYIEKVESSTERSVSDNDNQNQTVQVPQQHQPSQQANSKVADTRQDKKILLPVDESFIGFGLRSNPSTGVRWLAEWCLMMIKKYPGRVFYSPTNTYD